MSASTGTAVVADTATTTDTNTGPDTTPDAGTKKGLFARAGDYDNLTAFERTILKVIRYCLLAGLITALPIVSQAFTTPGIDWTQVLHTALAAFGSAALLALVKYLTARNEVQIAGKPEAKGRTAGPTQPKAAIAK